MAAVREEGVAHPAFVAKLAALRLPDGDDGEFLFDAVEADGGVVGRFEDGHLALVAVGQSPERHADSVATVGDEPHRRDRGVVDGIGNALVERHDQGVAGLAREGLGVDEGRGEGALGAERDGELGAVGVELDPGGDVEAGRGVEEREVEPVAGQRRGLEDGVVVQAALGPAPPGPAVEDVERAVGGVQRELERGVAEPQFRGKVFRPPGEHIFFLRNRDVVDPRDEFSAAEETGLDGGDARRDHEAGLDRLPGGRRTRRASAERPADDLAVRPQVDAERVTPPGPSIFTQACSSIRSPGTTGSRALVSKLQSAWPGWVIFAAPEPAWNWSRSDSACPVWGSRVKRGFQPARPASKPPLATANAAGAAAAADAAGRVRRRRRW